MSLRSVRRWRPLCALSLCSAFAGCVTSSSDPASEPTREPRAPQGLVYVSRRWVPELGETVTITKRPTSAVVEYADGRQESLASLHRRIDAFDEPSIDATFLAHVREGEAGGWLRANVFLDPGPSGAAPAARADAAQKAAAAWATAAGPEVRVSRASQYAAVLEVEASRAGWRSLLSRLPAGTVQIFPSHVAARAEAFSLVDPTEVLKTREQFNAAKNFGAGIRLGFVETGFRGGGIYGQHEAFARSDIHYQTAPVSCQSDDKCTAFSPWNTCVEGRCTNAHATAVASVVAHAKGFVGGSASDASLYFANGGEPCLLDEYLKQLDWFVEHDVHIVTETFRCHDGDGVDFGHGYATDYYARAFDMTFLVSAGNQTSGELDVACATTNNSICTGGIDDEGRLFCASSFGNATIAGSPSDREEPDVVSYAGQGGDCVSSFNLLEAAVLSGPKDWGGMAGTSFASPSVASQLALAAKACGLPHFDHLAARAAARNLGHASNPDGWNYSTPQPVPYGLLPPGDQKDGGGFPLFGPCRASDPDRETGSTVPGETAYETLPEGEVPNLPPGERRLAVNTGPAGKPGYPIGARSMLAGARLRATISWDACTRKSKVLDGTGTVAEVRSDFDLYLYNKSAGRYVFGSQSLDDNNEGFDVVVPEDGDYVVFLAWNHEPSKCFGDLDRVAHDLIYLDPLRPWPNHPNVPLTGEHPPARSVVISPGSPVLSSVYERKTPATRKLVDASAGGSPNLTLAPVFDTTLVVASRLLAVPETLWRRLLGRGRVQERAIDELDRLPDDHPLRRQRSRDRAARAGCHPRVVLLTNIS